MATASLTWIDPTARVDGTALAASEIASIDIFDSVSGHIGSVLGGVQKFTTAVLTVGDHTFTVTCTDTTGHVSAASGPATVTVVAVLANPNPPSGLTATLNP